MVSKEIDNIIHVLNKFSLDNSLVKVDLKNNKIFFGYIKFIEDGQNTFFIIRNDKLPDKTAMIMIKELISVTEIEDKYKN